MTDPIDLATVRADDDLIEALRDDLPTCADPELTRMFRVWRGSVRDDGGDDHP